MCTEENSKGWIWWLLSLGIATFVVTIAVLTILHSKKHSHHQVFPVPRPPEAISHKYAQALKVALTFFPIQKGIFVCIYLSYQTWAMAGRTHDWNFSERKLSMKMCKDDRPFC